MSIGYFLSSEEFGPTELVRQAKLAEQAGFDPASGGHRGHLPHGADPSAVIAHAAATAAVQHEGRFTLGVGSGEALNEHVLGDRWPPAGTRLEMLEEAVEVIRALLSGEEITHQPLGARRRGRGLRRTRQLRPPCHHLHRAGLGHPAPSPARWRGRDSRIRVARRVETAPLTIMAVPIETTP